MTSAFEPRPEFRRTVVSDSSGHTSNTEQFLRKGIAYSVLAFGIMLILGLFGIIPFLYLTPGMVASFGVIISFGIHLNSILG